jgi:hypothetical protein
MLFKKQNPADVTINFARAIYRKSKDGGNLNVDINQGVVGAVIKAEINKLIKKPSTYLET